MKKNRKNVQIAIMLFISLVILSACRGGNKTTIVNKTDDLSQKIEYSGKIVFNKDETGVEYISDGGYLEFSQNGNKFKVENNSHGKINYQFNGDSEVSVLSNEQKDFVSRGIKIIIKERAKLNH